MKQRKLYKYNPETDNFERFYPSIKDRLKSVIFVFISALVLTAVILLGAYFVYTDPSEETLVADQEKLQQRIGLVENRLNATLSIMREVEKRDSNLYRVLLQMEPMNLKNFSGTVLSTMPPEHISKLKDSNLLYMLAQKMDTLEHLMFHQLISFNSIREIALEQQHKLNHIPSVLPLNIRDYTTSSGFGQRVDPVYGTGEFHAGIDIASSLGTEVYATADGKVSFAGEKNGYGNCIDIEHGYDYMTRYAHLSKILVHNGKEVKRGELIGLVGSTGKSTGPHLHYEVRFKEEPQNPVNYFFLDITPEQYDEMIEIAENAGRAMD